MRLITVLFLIGASAATAQDFVPRSSDAVLDRASMEQAVIGETHEFYDGGQSFFSVSGTYTYTYSDGTRAYGRWAWPQDNQDGVICTAFNHGFQRCDMYVRAGDRLVLITEDGSRFPVRINSADS
jgi:hypothetical protein